MSENMAAEPKNNRTFKSEEFYVRVVDNEVSLRAISGGRRIQRTIEPFGTIVIIGDRKGLPEWLHDEQTVDIRHEITFTDGSKLNVHHPMMKLRLREISTPDEP